MLNMLSVDRGNLRCVREKTQDQLDLQALHRVRSRLVSKRTANAPDLSVSKTTVIVPRL